MADITINITQFAKHLLTCKYVVSILLGIYIKNYVLICIFLDIDRRWSHMHKDLQTSQINTKLQH